MRFDKRRRLIEFVVVGLITTVTFCIILLLEGFFPFGKGSVVALDLNSQYTPLLYRFYDIVTGAKGVSIDFHLAGGMNIFADSVTELINPVNYLLLLFGRDNIYLSVNLLLVVYAVIASLTSYGTLRYLFPSKRNLNIVFSISYALSFFAAYQFEIIRWMLPIALFPLYFLSILRLLKKGKPVQFVLFSAYFLMLSLQIGIQALGFTLVFSIFFFLKERKEGVKIGYRCLILMLSVISSLLISSVILVPEIINLMSSSRSMENSIITNIVTSHGFDDIIERIFEVISPASIGLSRYVFYRLKGKRIAVFKENKYLLLSLLLLFLTVLFEPSNLIWHLGSYKCFPVRYGFMVLFYSFYILQKLFEAVGETKVIPDGIETVVNENESVTDNEPENIKKSNKKEIIINIFIMLLGILIIFIAYSRRLEFSQAFATLAVSLLCFKEALMFYGLIKFMSVLMFVTARRNGIEDKGKRGIFLIILSAFSGIFIYICILFPNTSLARQYNEEAYSEMNSVVNEEVSVFETHVRDNNKYPLNAALVTNDYSFTAYIPSGEGKYISEAMSALSYDTPWISIRSQGGSAFSDMILGIDNPNVEKPLNGGILVSDITYGNIKKADSEKELSKALSEEYINKAVDVEKSNRLAELNDAIAFKNNRTILFDNRKQTITIISEEPMKGNLLLPVAYINGWSSDSGNVGSYFNGFLSVENLNGENTIIIRYSLPGKILGIVFSIFGVILGAFLIFIVGKNSENEKEYKAAAVIFKVISVGFISVVYILANLLMFIYMGFKFFGIDLKPLIQPQTYAEQSSVLMGTNVRDDGIEVIIGKENILLEGAEISADSEENSDLGVSNITDGDVKSSSSRWSSSNDWDKCDHYLQAEFEEESTISGLKIYWERTNASKYYIKTSMDGENWKIVSSFEEPSKEKEQVIVFDSPVSCKYIRLHVTDVERKEEDLSLYYQNVSVYEWEIYRQLEEFVVEAPTLSNGNNRKVPVPEVPEDYELSVGGINYDYLLNEEYFKDTISDISINLGYILTVGDKEYSLPGFNLILPASKESSSDKFPYENIEVREWKSDNKEISLKNRGFVVQAEGVDADKKAELFKKELEEAVSVAGDDIFISLEEDSSMGEAEKEVYEIEILNDSKIVIKSPSYMGIRRGEVTLLKMIEENPDKLPCGIIRDYPEYEVRGFSIDLGRRPISVELLKTVIDEMSSNNMNTLQLHLNDNAIISESEFDGTVEGARNLYSGFRLESSLGLSSEDFIYSNEDIKELIHYGYLKGIEIVPEIDTPAHSLAITKVLPELGYSDDPNMVDTLDVGRTETVNTVIDIWKEYLNGKDNKTALFEDVNTVHLGMDEYYGEFGDYHDYIIAISRAIKDMAPQKKLRMWGSLTYREMELSDIPKNIELMIWSTIWAEPDTLYEEGFSLINCLNNNLYIIVGGGLDRLDTEYLKNDWEPNVYDTAEKTTVLPKWSPKVLGACYSLWNDNYTKGIDSTTEEDLLNRITEPMKILAEKLW